MRARSWIFIVCALAAGCGDSLAEPPMAAGALQPATQHPPQQRTGPAPPHQSVSAEASAKAAECQQLQDQALDDFGAAVGGLGLTQCVANDDCSFASAARAGDASVPEPFSTFHDACWETCSITPGTQEYVQALKGVGARVCRAFRAAGCPVFPSSCPFHEPVVLRCSDGTCR